MALPSDLIDLLAEFAREKVDVLLVGGEALAFDFMKAVPCGDFWRSKGSS